MHDFNIMFGAVMLIAGCIFALTLAMIFSPKLRGKMMSRQIKSLRYMAEYAKEDLEKTVSDLSEASINARSRVLDENEDKLKDIADRSADISKDAITTTVSAVKKGIVGTAYCKHCGKPIDEDSRFCKHCGKEQ
ncbi:MAG: zinc ribbon domain-containing protein [Erysipelotrichaceae bacterium]|nr:zinc ribbon domain-containing protein [Erysipelotrichaceae bacterium]